MSTDTPEQWPPPKKNSKARKTKASDNYRARNTYIPSAFWWQAEVDPNDPHPDEVSTKVSTLVRDLFARQKSIWERDKRHVAAYLNASMRGLGPHSHSKRAEEPAEFTYNLCQSVVESLMSHFATKKTRPQILTDIGDPATQKKAAQMQQAMDGLFYEGDYYKHHNQAIFDGSVLDFGGIHFFEKEESEGLRPGMERLTPWEVLVDEVEAFYGERPNLGIHKCIAADALAAQDVPGSVWEGVTSHLAGAKLLRDDDPGTDKPKGHMVSVIEYWHAPSPGKAKDGKHFIGLSNWTAVYEQWDESIPVEVFRWMPQIPVGWRGQGVVERLYELNEKLKILVARCQKCAELGSVKIGVDHEMKIAKNQMTNEDYTIIKFTGSPPVVLNLGTIPAEWQQLIATYIQWGHDLIGINEMSTQATKPSGIVANSALETMADIQSKRLASPEMAADDFVIRCTKQLIRRSRAIDKKTRGGFKVMLYDGSGIKPMLWKDIDIDDADFRLKIFPSNYLPQNPGARLQKVIDLSGQIPELREHFLSLLDFPDIQSVTKLLSSPTTVIMMALQKVLEDGDASTVEPEASWNQDIAIALADKFICNAQVNGVDEGRIELLRNFRDACIENKKNEAAQAAQQAQVNQANSAAGPGEAMPLGAPAAAPAPVSQAPGAMS